ncbi:MAG: hypothetical protein RL372_784 [Bacteroidota bacterium]
MLMKNKFTTTLLFFVLHAFAVKITAQELYKTPNAQTKTVWVSPENPSGAKGSAGTTNKGAKGRAFITLETGKKVEVLNTIGSGIVRRMWLSGTIPRSADQMQHVRIEMYWDGSKTPAVSAPIGDFFGLGLGKSKAYKNALFSNPEGRSFNFTIPMPFKKSAKIVLVNESNSHALIWYDINYTLEKVPEDAMYFHAYWNHVSKTTLGTDYEILPALKGKGRFIGSNISVISDSLLRNTWFGEGEVKVYLDGDNKLPSLSGTGTEDYIGSGWGQGEYQDLHQGSLISDDKNGVYCFYRYHVPDPIFFNSDCKVTLQQIGNSSVENIRALLKKGANIKPVFFIKQRSSSDIFNLKDNPPITFGLLDTNFVDGIHNSFFDSSNFGMNFYRTDEVSSTAYFYLTKPTNNLNTGRIPHTDYQKGSFGYDLAFLKKHHANAVQLKNGEASIIVLPNYQGRVMTSTAEGDKGFSFGWINHDLIASGQPTPHFNAFGGEERFWLGPEGGQFSIYFKPGTAFTFDNWYVPPSLDTEGFDVVSSSNTEALFNKKIHLLNYAGTKFDLEVNRKIKLLSTQNITQTLGIQIGASIKTVGFETENNVKNIGKAAWTKNTGLLSIWVLSMLQANDHTSVFVPFKKGDPATLGKIVTDDYFGKLDTSRLKIKDGYLLFKADAQQRSKIGVSPLRALPMAASYDAQNKVLTIVQFTMPNNNIDYVNSLWQIQDDPFKGDALNAYTDGPVNGKQMGKFYELEGSSPAMALLPGSSQTHIQKTIHLKGAEADLNAVTQKLFGVKINQLIW